MNTILPKVTMYDKELRLVQSSIKALQNQLKGQGDQLGEQIYNLEEKTKQ